jgi:hypothetical protein
MFGLGRSIYYIQRYLWHRQRDQKRRERERQRQSWRAVRAVAAQSRLKQQSKPSPRPTPQPLTTRVRQIDLPDKATKIYDNISYGKFSLKTLVTLTNFLFTPSIAPTTLVANKPRKESHQ